MCLRLGLRLVRRLDVGKNDGSVKVHYLSCLYSQCYFLSTHIFSGRSIFHGRPKQRHFHSSRASRWCRQIIQYSLIEFAGILSPQQIRELNNTPDHVPIVFFQDREITPCCARANGSGNTPPSSNPVLANTPTPPPNKRQSASPPSSPILKTTTLQKSVSASSTHN